MALTFQTLSSKINPKYLKNNENNQAFQAKSFDGNDSFVKKSENNNNVSFTGRSEKFSAGHTEIIELRNDRYEVYASAGGWGQYAGSVYSEEEARKWPVYYSAYEYSKEEAKLISNSDIKSKYYDYTIIKGAPPYLDKDHSEYGGYFAENVYGYHLDSVNVYIADPDEKVPGDIFDSHHFIIQKKPTEPTISAPPKPETQKTEKNTPSTVEQALKRIEELTEELTKLKNSLKK